MKNQKSAQEVFPDLDIYDRGEQVTNLQTRESFNLSAEELSVYDYVCGLHFQIRGLGGPEEEDAFEYRQELRKGLSWFKEQNNEAYDILNLKRLENFLIEPLD